MMHDPEAKAWYIGRDEWASALVDAIKQAKEDETIYLWSEGQKAVGDMLQMSGRIRPGFHIALVVNKQAVEEFYDRHRQTG